MPLDKDDDSIMAVYQAYYTQLKAKGVALISFKCPHCSEVIETEPAPEGEEWDTHSICPHCERLYYKITKGATACGILSRLTEYPNQSKKEV